MKSSEIAGAREAGATPSRRTRRSGPRRSRTLRNVTCPHGEPVSAGAAGVAMFANKTRILLTFREDVLGRARVFPGLKLAEHLNARSAVSEAGARSLTGSGRTRCDR